MIKLASVGISLPKLGGHSKRGHLCLNTDILSVTHNGAPVGVRLASQPWHEPIQ